MKQLIHNDWLEILKPQFESAYYAQLHNFLKEEIDPSNDLSRNDHIFERYNTPFSKVKVVILGQDPYHGPNQAHGCSFLSTAWGTGPAFITEYLQRIESYF